MSAVPTTSAVNVKLSASTVEPIQLSFTRKSTMMRTPVVA